MKKLNTNIKEKPIIAALLIAVIIGLICLIIYTISYYEPQRENPPILKINYQNEELFELLPIAYNWTYKNTNNTQELSFDPNNYDYSNCTIYKAYSGQAPSMTASPRYKIKIMSKVSYMYNPETHQYEKYDSDYQNFSEYTKLIYLTQSQGTSHTYVSVYTLNFGNQGSAVYVVKVVEQSDYKQGVIREYSGLMLENTEIVEELISKLPGGVFIEKIEAEENKISIIYKYRITKTSANSIAITLFSCIDRT